MNRYLSLACSLVAFFYLSSCESYSEPTEKAHQSDQPIVLTSFYPKEGGARDKILLDGKNFGTDVSKIKVFQQCQSLRRFIKRKPYLCHCTAPSGR